MSDRNSILDTGANAADKQGFAHFMLKEIYEQPEVVRKCLTAYLSPEWQHTQSVMQSSPVTFNLPPALYADVAQIQIVACGTSRHAGLVGQYWLEQIAGIPARVRSASEFVAAPLPPVANTLTIAVTQSGETADTLAAVAVESVRRAQQGRSQSTLLGITNQPESSLAKAVDFTIPTLAGTEIGVAATKTFLAQLVVFYCLTLDLAYRHQRLTDALLQQKVTQLQSLPDQIENLLKQVHKPIEELAQTLVDVQDCIVLGRGVNRAIALEGALKLKETTYIHAEGYAGGEFMHGPIAMLDKTVPVIAIAPAGSVYENVIANAKTIKPNGVPLIGITNVPPSPDAAVFDRQLMIAPTDEHLSPFLTVVPLQLLAYTIAVQRGLDVDRPRNITKTLSQ